MSVRVVGDAAVVARFEALPGDVRGKLKQSIGRMALRLQAKVMRDKLSGQVLQVRTGTLRRSINQVVIDNGNEIKGKVGSNLKYARAHEYGFQGAVTVKAHMRQIKQAFGKAIAPRAINISTHSRQMNLPERSFLRSALAEMQDDIVNDMKQTVGEAIKP